MSTQLQVNVQQTLNDYALLRTGAELLPEATRQQIAAQAAFDAADAADPNKPILEQNLATVNRRVTRLTALDNKVDVGNFLSSVAQLWDTAKTLKDNMSYSDSVREVMNQSDATFDALLRAMQSGETGAAPTVQAGSDVPSNPFARFVASIETIEAADSSMGPAQKSALRLYKAIMGIMNEVYAWSNSSAAPADNAEHPRVTIGWHLAIIRAAATNLGTLNVIQAERFRD